MTKPTVGRVVQYYKEGRIQFEHGWQPHAALIAYVHSDECINIGYFDSNGNAHSATSVRLIQDGDPLPESGFCCWMAYQKGQAAKTEEMEKKLAEKE